MITAEVEIGLDLVKVKFAAVHCSPSMGFAYYHSGMKGPTAKIDRTSNTSAGSHNCPEIATFGAQVTWIQK